VYGVKIDPNRCRWYTIAGTLYETEYRHLEVALVIAMLDMADLLRNPLIVMGYSKVPALLRDAAPLLNAELTKKMKWPALKNSNNLGCRAIFLKVDNRPTRQLNQHM